MVEYYSASHAPSANVAAVATIPAIPNQKLDGVMVAWSYNGAVPSGGNLKIQTDSGGTPVTLLNIDTAFLGCDQFLLTGIRSGKGKDLYATLAAAGGSCSGKVNLFAKQE